MNNYNQILSIMNITQLLKLFNEMNVDEKYEFMQYLSEQQKSSKVKELIIHLADHPKNFVRNEIFNILSAYPSESNINDLFIKSLNDPDEMIRVNAVEMVGERRISSTGPALIKMLQDNSFLVRGNAAISLSELGDKKGREGIKRRLRHERNSWVKVHLLTSLYKYGDKQKLSKIIYYLKSKSYQVRCATANILSSIANDSNKNQIISSLYQVLEIEKTIAVRSCLQEAIDDLEA